MLRANNRPILAYFDAIKNLRLRQVALILRAGYDPNLLVNARGLNGLQYMINYFGATDAHFRLQVPLNKSAYISIAKLLLDSGLDPNLADLLTDETILFDAIRFNDKEMVALLLNYSDLAIRNKNGETPLMCAARFGNKHVMRLLLDHLRHLEMDGYFLRQRNRFGLTALELARAENIECAKVLTKHLITYGHHTNAVLARSSSHHQLMARALPYHLRSTVGYGARAPAAALLDADSGSDFEGDLALGYAPTPARLARGRSLVGGRAAVAAASYDPKAAEFSQYLLEHQELAAQGGSPPNPMAAGGGSQRNAISDDDDDDVDDYMAPQVQPSGSGLTRSRSCILGPSSRGTGQQKYSSTSGGGAGGPSTSNVNVKSNKTSSSSWGDAARG